MGRLGGVLWDGWRWWLRWLDLTGADGGPSFAKLVTVAVLVVAVWTETFGVTIAVAVLAASFGRSTFVALLRARATRPNEGSS